MPPASASYAVVQLVDLLISEEQRDRRGGERKTATERYRKKKKKKHYDKHEQQVGNRRFGAMGCRLCDSAMPNCGFRQDEERMLLMILKREPWDSRILNGSATLAGATKQGHPVTSSDVTSPA